MDEVAALPQPCQASSEHKKSGPESRILRPAGCSSVNDTFPSGVFLTILSHGHEESTRGIGTAHHPHHGMVLTLLESDN